MTIFSAALLLFLVMDPFGNIPLFLSALKDVPPERQRRVVARELVIALGLLVTFLFGGQVLLRALGLTEATLTIAGGIILFLIALRMVFPPAEGSFAHDLEQADSEPFIVPLAIPFLAGPSSLATVLFIMNSAPERWPEWLAAIALAWAACGAVLMFLSNIARLLRRRGLIAMERLMGMILTAISVKMILTGVKAFFGL